MKALTNILTYMLLMLLLLIPAACTEEAAEVDNLTRQEEYVSVRINIPSMKSATTRADEAEDNLTSIVALVFRDDALVSKTEVTTTASTLTTTTSTTGTFNIPRPKSGDVIHFLGNLPSDVTLPEVGASESALCSLETGEREKLSYWGKATYDGGNIDVTLYRHLAKIEIAAGEDCTFPKDELFIAGLINANTKGKLVPYDEENETFNFNLADHDYPTAVSSPLAETDELTNYGAGYSSSYYVFEHDNPETSDGLYVICKFGDIGKCYYKVALTSDGKTPYKIIRNHRYVIYVNDLDEGVGSYDDALIADPINLEVKEMKDVTLTVAEQNISLPYSTNAIEEVSLTVTVPKDVQTLTIETDAFTVTTGDSKVTLDNGNTYRIINTEEEQTVLFKLRLNNDATNNHTITISGTGADEYTTVISATTSINTTPYSATVTNENTLWLGAVRLDNNNQQTQIPVSYSLFFDGNETQVMPEGSKLFIEYEGSEGWIQAATPNSGGDWAQLPDYNAGNNPIAVTITDAALSQIREHHNGDVAFYVQGNDGKILKKIYWVRATGTITATKANDNPLYHNTDNQSITVTAIVPAGVSTLYINAADFTVTQNGQSLNLNNNVYVYNIANTSNQNEIPFVFTLKSEVNEVKSSTIMFSGDLVSSDLVNVVIEELDIPDVSITSTSNTTLYWNDDNPTSFDVTVRVPTLDGCSLNQLNITADGFTIKQNGNTLGTNSYTDNTSRASSATVTYTFTPTGTGNGKTITFFGSGTMVDVHETSFIIDVPTITAAADKAELYYNVENQTVTVTANIPSGVSAISIEAPDFSVALNNGNGGTFNVNTNTFTCNGATTAVFVFTLNSGIESANTSTITFSDATEGNKVGSDEISVKLKEQVAGGEVWEKELNLSVSGSITTHTTDFTADELAKFVVGKTLSIEVDYTEKDWGGLRVLERGTTWTDLPSAKAKYNNGGGQHSVTDDIVFEFTLTQEDIDLIIKGKGFDFWGNSIVIAKISVK